MPRVAVFPGSFDPMTNGHVDLVRRSCRIFDRVVVAVLLNSEKSPLFSVEERIAMIGEVFRRQPGVEVKAFSGLLVHFVRKERAKVVVRGLRVPSDFEYEFTMAQMNRRLDPDVETIYLTPKEEWSYVSSRLVKDVHRLGGDVSGLVPEPVQAALVRKLPNGTKGAGSLRRRR